MIWKCLLNINHQKNFYGRICAYVHTQRQLEKSCKMTEIDGDFCHLQAFNKPLIRERNLKGIFADMLLGKSNPPSSCYLQRDMNNSSSS